MISRHPVRQHTGGWICVKSYCEDTLSRRILEKSKISKKTNAFDYAFWKSKLTIIEVKYSENNPSCDSFAIRSHRMLIFTKAWWLNAVLQTCAVRWCPVLSIVQKSDLEKDSSARISIFGYPTTPFNADPDSNPVVFFLIKAENKRWGSFF